MYVAEVIGLQGVALQTNEPVPLEHDLHAVQSSGGSP